jgi:aspartokinase
MVTTSEVAVSVTVDSAVNLPEIIRELEPFGAITVEENFTIVSVVGNEIAETKDVLVKLFDSIKDVPVRISIFHPLDMLLYPYLSSILYIPYPPHTHTKN